MKNRKVQILKPKFNSFLILNMEIPNREFLNRKVFDREFLNRENFNREKNDREEKGVPFSLSVITRTTCLITIIPN